jgi:hypothetical protein
VTNVFIGSNLVANGKAGGPFYQRDRGETAFGPEVQAGYFESFGGGAWQGGLSRADPLVADRDPASARAHAVYRPHLRQRASLYASGGPALFGTKSKILDGVGYVVIGGNPVTSPVCRYTSRATTGCGAARRKLAWDYYFSPCWFLDLNYTYPQSAE